MSNKYLSERVIEQARTIAEMQIRVNNLLQELEETRDINEKQQTRIWELEAKDVPT